MSSDPITVTIASDAPDEKADPFAGPRYSDEARAIAHNKWRQLRCKATTLTFNVHWVRCIYILIAIITIPIGIFTYSLSQAIVVQEFDAYNKNADCSLADKAYGKECIVEYTLEHDFAAPVYFHYKLTKFYQNHRSYVKSRSVAQLQNVDVNDVAECDPMQDHERLHLLPCGLIAYSFFNDRFRVIRLASADNHSRETHLCPEAEAHCYPNTPSAMYPNAWTPAAYFSEPGTAHNNWDISKVAWASDKAHIFAKTKQTSKTTNRGALQRAQNITLPATTDDDFIVWMRTATVSTFTKLHRVIHELSLKKGDVLRVHITNFFDVSDFGGTKAIVLTTNGPLGGKNDVLGIGFMAVGSLSLLTAILFWVFVPPTRSASHNA